MSDVPSVVPLRLMIARTLTLRGQTETFGSLSALFQGACTLLRDAGALPLVYGPLASIKQRILNQGRPLSLDDVEVLARSYSSQAKPDDALVLSPPWLVLSVRPSGDLMTYHRELVQNLQHPEKPQMTLNQEVLIEVLAAVLHPRPYLSSDLGGLVNLPYPQQEGLNTLRILDMVYKATFSRTVRRELCEPKILFPLPARSFRLKIDLQKTAHFSLELPTFLTPFLVRLYRTPDLASVLDGDVRAKTRVQEGLRLLSGALHDTAEMPAKREEIDALLKARRSADTEDLEEL